uniref:DNA-directed DNA polymerase n=1 Tax=Angiostrongylus cantonensis TaxID=6313 RepID=A0A158P9Q9_ANGCA
MQAPEQLQLIMEPLSAVYFDPVIVLDFQVRHFFHFFIIHSFITITTISLYPSMVIAYNYCFSTLFGKDFQVSELESMHRDNEDVIEIGAIRYKVQFPKLKMKTCMPCVVSLLTVIGARVMVKNSMRHATSKRLKRILDARQLALKLIANVTYGYTSANFSGRMPCVEVADAILGKGRETLERAISLVNRGDYNGARVIYGDTDSMFVLVPGATKDQAFSIGRRIAADVTNDNPAPVVLKLEKTKKRYAGWMYENEEDDVGQLDSKGIETIRRDTCLIVAKVLERSLKLIFTRNWRALGLYLNTKLSRLKELPYTDFIFSKEFRGQYSENAHVPQLKVALSLAANNPSHIALVGERLPYVVTDGPPNATVISCVRSLQEFLADSSLQIHFIYYVHVHILPALRRVTDLLQLKIRWHPEGRSLCFTPGCSTLGSDPWCSSCIDDQSTLQFALCSLAREDRLRAICRSVCAHCQKNPLCHMDRCVNHQCIIKKVFP